jgi:hypothetical protein
VSAGGVAITFDQALAEAVTAHAALEQARQRLHDACDALATFCPVVPGDTYEWQEHNYGGSWKQRRMRVRTVTASQDRWHLEGYAIRADGTDGIRHYSTTIKFSAIKFTARP